jgi:hypothetical protein
VPLKWTASFPTTNRLASILAGTSVDTTLLLKLKHGTMHLLVRFDLLIYNLHS